MRTFSGKRSTLALAIEAEVTFTLKLECFTRNRIFQRRFNLNRRYLLLAA